MIDDKMYKTCKDCPYCYKEVNQLSIFDFFKAEKEAKEQKCGIH